MRIQIVRLLRDWTCSILFLAVFGLTMVLWDMALRVSSLFGKRVETYVAGALQWWLLRLLRICGIRVQLDRSPEIQPGRSYIIVSNHQSMFDMPIHGSVFLRNFPKYISKRELAKWIPSVSFHLRSGGHAIIDRRDRQSAVKAIAKLAREIVDEGFSAVIFPEGTRGRAGLLRPFRPAGTVALLEQAPAAEVVPVCIDNSYRLMERGLLPVPYGITLRVWVGAPIARSAREDPYAIVASCERQIQEAMARMRGTTVDAVVLHDALGAATRDGAGARENGRPPSATPRGSAASPDSC